MARQSSANTLEQEKVSESDLKSELATRKTYTLYDNCGASHLVNDKQLLGLEYLIKTAEDATFHAGTL
ncbi:hypothetical protein NHQ30_007070 [Ciborinia camelliae]|nr:hypothetical protein NHQ30_007070 [Ciborinia camelliae]